jgi:gas vesicle structural protein
MAERLPITRGRRTGDRGRTPTLDSRPPMRTLKKEVSLAEALDRVLNKGVVVVGEMTISVADIDLLYLGINLLLTSVETVEREFEKSYAKKLPEIP